MPGLTGFQQLRIFVSSTFNDMRRERTVLLEKVFPMVAKYCHQRKVEFIGVDLRWGVSEEQSRRGETVAICMSEIDRCRPLFMGMVGERYGWVPDGKNISVTEDEILYGALEAPKDTEAFFYLRDGELTEELCGPYEPDPRIDDLKRRIRKSGYPVMDGYRDLDSFGRRAYEDLIGAVDRLTADAEETDPVEVLRNDQFFLAQRYAATFADRPDDYARLDEYAQKDGLVILTGEEGCGKTALLARWVLDRNAKEGQHATEDTCVAKDPCADKGEYLFLYFVGSDNDKGWEQMGRQLIAELCRYFSLEIPETESQEALRRGICQILHMAARKGRVILALDQLNALALDDGYGLSWLPESLPEGICVLVTLDECEALNRLRRRPHREMTLENLSPNEVARVATSFLAAHSKTLSMRHLNMLQAAEHARNPLYLITLLNEIRQVGRHNLLTEQLEDYLSCKEIGELFDRMLTRVDRDYDEEDRALPRRFLTLIEASRGGLTEGELISLLDHVPLARLVPLQLALGEYTAENGGTMHIVVPQFRQAVRKHYGLEADALEAARRELIAWFTAHQDTPRRNYELPWLLRETGEKAALGSLLAEVDCFEEIWRRNKYELKSYWVEAEGEPAKAYENVLAAPGEYAQELVLDLAAFFLEIGHSAEAGKLLDHITNDVEQEDTRVLCMAWGLLGNLYQNEGYLIKAEYAYKRRAALAEELGDRYEQQRALGNIGLVSLMRGETLCAKEAFERVLQLAEELNQRDGQQIALGNLGNIAVSLGDLEKAVAIFERQKTISMDSGNPAGIIHACGALGVLHMKNGELKAAEAEFAEQEKQSRLIGAADGLANALGNRANLAQACGDTESAESLYREKLKLCKESGQAMGEQNALGNLSALAALRGDWEGAYDWAKQWTECTKKKRLFRQYAEALTGLAKAEKALGLDEDARLHVMQAAVIAKQHGFSQKRL